jgi:uncharacterized membrane protein
MSDELDPWLKRMRWALARLPDDARDDIVRETRAHLEERIAKGTTARAALDAFGRAEDYAASFVEEWELVAAAGARNTTSMLSAVLRRAHRSVVAALAVVLVATLSVAAFVAALTAVMKIVDPVHAGLWRGNTAFFLGVIDNPASAHELLGAWIFPLAALAIALAVLAARSVLVWAVRRLALSV